MGVQASYRDGKHFFLYFLAVCTSLENYLFNSFTHLFIELLFLWSLAFVFNVIFEFAYINNMKGFHCDNGV
jgi:hypothetical protein